MKKIDTDLYQSMVNYIETMIASGQYPSGSKLPSLRELEQKFGISFNSVRRGIEELAAKGLIESHHGSGNYVVERTRRKMVPANGFRKLAVFLETDNFDSSYCAQALNGAKEYAENNNIALMLNFSSIGTITEEFVTSRAEGCDAALFLGCYDLRLRRMPIAIPAVGLSMHNTYNGMLSAFELDPLQAAEIACRFFSERKCRRVKVISHDLPVHKWRGKVFLENWSNFGEAEIQLLHDYVQADCSESDCGYYFVSGTDYDIAAKCFTEMTGGKLVQERMVLSVDGKSLFVPGYDPVNTIYLDWKNAGRMALEECIRRLAIPGAGAQRIYLNCQLKEVPEIDLPACRQPEKISVL